MTSSHSAHVASSYTTPSMTGGVGGWSGPVHAQLEGPGMPVARSIVTTHPAVLTGPGVDGGSGGGAVGVGVAGNGTSMDAGDGADDGAEADDGRLYCYCQVGSYGDMVACDDTECKHEWVSRAPCTLFVKTGLMGVVSASSIWGALGSTSHQKACGSAIRAESSLRINANWRVLLHQEGQVAVRTGILVRRVHPRRFRNCLAATLSPHRIFVCYFVLA